jgi:hypothetical protein
MACLALPAVIGSAQSQAVPQLRLKPASAKLDEEFTSIGSVRELSDGRVLITDTRDRRVVVADLKNGTVTQVGRTGDGPAEYAMAAPIHRLAGDSSIMFDVMTRRWLLFDGASIVATMPPDAPIITAMKGSAKGSDVRGNVWRTASPPGMGGGAPDDKSWKPGSRDWGGKDSEFVVRGNRATAKVDTVAKVRMTPARQTVVMTPGGAKVQSVSWVRPPMVVGEDAVLFPDGWFAIARLDPYRVDWIAPDGRVAKGRPIALPQIKVTPAEKDAYFARQLARRAPNAPKLPESILRDMEALRDQFPEVMPPYTAFGLSAGGDGSLWLQHEPSIDFPDARYDVVDRRGVLVAVVSLAKRESIIGLGPRSVYVVWKDSDDIERLRRHPWP